MKAKRFGIDGKEKGSVELPKELFEAEINEHLIWEAVKSYLGNQRQGTAAAKNRAKVSGGGRKPWRQKGTGRARAGSNTSPLWPGGGVAFPPRPRDYTTRLNAKAKLRALCGALSARAREGAVMILDAPSFEQPKTKTLAELIEKVGLHERKVLWIFDRIDAKALKSARNLARLRTTESRTLNTYELMHCESLVLTEDGLKSLTERVHAAEQDGGDGEGKAKKAERVSA
ncbi:MAG TPA: 50S ribosomal protein L4 [Candidatus Dormibacteraeota bacterium]|nr:50S ribosomal protein L4 [Candidatus Dormibacteraeota bacterium]